MRDVKDIRITDPYVRRRVEAARQQAGEATMTRTAARLILERLAQLEITTADAPASARPCPELSREVEAVGVR